MDKNQKQRFWNMVLTGYTVGSLVCMLITYIRNITALPYIRASHIHLLIVGLSISFIWVKLYRRGMPKKDLWKVRVLMIIVLIAEYSAFQIIYRLIHLGIPKVLNVLPQVLLTGCGLIIVGMIVSYIISDGIERACLKRINEKLSQNKPQ